MKAENDAALAALTAAWPQGRVFVEGDVDDSPVTPYLVVAVSSGSPRNYRVGSQASSTFRRITVRLIGKTYNEAAFAAEKAAAALLNKRLTVTGRVCTPCRQEREANIQRDPDGGVSMYGLLTYTYASSPA